MDKPYLIQYKEAIESGFVDIDGVKTRLVVGWKIKKAVDIVCSYFEDERFSFDPKMCYRKIEFMETCCLQGKAPFYGQPMKLMLWEKAFMEAIYSFREKATGNLLINEALLEVARKNGKTTFIAGDCNSDLFIGDGGVDVCCASNDDKQAKLIWEEVAGMRRRLDPKDEVTSQNLSELRNDANNIKVIRLSSKTQNKDGRNFKKAYIDEAHDMKNDEIAQACKRSMSTHDEHLLITISTNGFLNDMYFDQQLERANRWLNGEVDNPHYLPWLFEMDDESEVWGNDRDLWQKANPSLIYGVKKWSFIEQSIADAQTSKQDRLHLLCKDFNIKVSNGRAWLNLEEYDYPQEPFTLKEFEGGFCLGAVDLSDVGDLTCAEIVLKKKGDDRKYVVAQFFIPESKLNDKDNGAKYKEWSAMRNPQTGEPYIIVAKGNRINQKDVADWFQRLRRTYRIETLMIGYDRWHSDVFLLWCDAKTGYGLPTTAIPQNPNVMSYPMKMVERDLLARNINYGNNPILKYNFSNTSAKIKDDKIMAEKIDGQYARKIDGVVTLIILYAVLERNEATLDNYVMRR